MRGLTQKNWPNRPISPREKALFRVLSDAKSIQEIQELLKYELVLAALHSRTQLKSHTVEATGGQIRQAKFRGKSGYV